MVLFPVEMECDNVVTTSPSKQVEDDTLTSKDKTKGDRTGIQSLERAFMLLETIAGNPRGITLAELSKQSGLHTSTTFHLVKTMEHCGYVRQARDSKRYSLGGMIFSIAANAKAELDMGATAAPILETLAAATGETSHFSILAGGEIIIAARAAGPGVFQIQEKNGGVRPGHATALGKMILAHMSVEERDQYFANHPLVPLTEKTITEREKLERQFSEIVKVGIAYDDEEMIPELRCVAAAVWDQTGVVGSVGISGPVWKLSLQRLNEVSERVSEAARELSVALGGNPH
jgi:DNA-binding IclR family transcriptional regulator